MRAAQALRIEAEARRALEYPRLGWSQAGLKSFAYRLAHLRAPRFPVVGSLIVLFYFL